MSGGGNRPGHDYLVQVRDAVYGPSGAFPDIIWDGVVAPANPIDKITICVRNGGAKLLNIDASNQFVNPVVNMTLHNCEFAKLGAVMLGKHG